MHKDVPNQQSRGIQNVTAPLYKSSTGSFVYVLSAFAVIIFAWYAYKGVSVASSVVSNASPFGSSSSSTPSSKSGDVPVNVGESRAAREEGVGGEMSVERHIEELAKAFGMPSKDLASAIAGAVREHVPPSSLSSVSKKAEKTGGSKVIDELTGEAEEGEDPASWTDTLGTVVGMDDMPE